MTHIWHADERIAWPTERRGAADESCDPAAELARFGRLKTLRSLLQRLVTQHGGPGASAPPLAFERWLARAALRRAAEADPVLPAADGVDTQLVANLARSLPRDKAVIIAEALSARSRDDAARQAAVFSDAAAEPVPEAAARRLVKSVRRAGKPLPTDAAAWAELATAAEALAAHARGRAEEQARPTYTVAVDRDGPNVRLAAMDGDAPKKPYVLISHDHYAKLTTLHARYGAGDPDERIFCLVTRYEALRGAGFQCAVPGACFESLREFLGNTIECFASPLNCRFERYFSAFPALERAFGSLGDFFEEASLTKLREGSFEVNPPFVPEVMEAALARVDTCLRAAAAAARPLSFLIVVPDWGGRASAADLSRRSPFARAACCIKADSHVYVDGAQHRKKGADRHRPSSWDTAVVLLQTDAGAAKWPLDAATLEATVAAPFARAATGEDLQAWEKRGPGRGGKKRPRSAPPKTTDIE